MWEIIITAFMAAAYAAIYAVGAVAFLRQRRFALAAICALGAVVFTLSLYQGTYVYLVGW